MHDHPWNDSALGFVHRQVPGSVVVSYIDVHAGEVLACNTRCQARELSELAAAVASDLFQEQTSGALAEAFGETQGITAPYVGVLVLKDAQYVHALFPAGVEPSLYVAVTCAADAVLGIVLSSAQKAIRDFGRERQGVPLKDMTNPSR